MSAQEPIILRNYLGFEVHILKIGAIVQRLIFPDRTDIVLGCDNREPYGDGTSPYFGAIVGRVANRIANATFMLGGRRYDLAANNGPNCLHGGTIGFSRKEWSVEEVGLDPSQSDPFVRLSLHSPDGEEGFPGSVAATVTYSLCSRAPKLRIVIEATAAEAATPINLAQHTYFNFGGHGNGTILQHQLHMEEATHWTPVNDVQIPTGEIVLVEGGPMDFVQPRAIGERIADVPGVPPGGYDHNFVLCGFGPDAKARTQHGMASKEPRLAATVRHVASGRGLKLYTTAPGLQLYSGNFLDGTLVGKDGVRYQRHAGLCLETQGFPDAVNQPQFPSVIVEPGESNAYHHKDVWEFLTAE